MPQEVNETTQEQQSTVTFDLIYLIGCAVNEIVPSLERVEQMDLQAVHRMSVRNSLSAISCMALEDTYGGKLPNTELFRQWEDEKNLAIYKNLLFDAERRELFAFLEESEIWYAPLKGILMKDLYPKLGMRQMADNDIFFDASQQEKVHEWFLSRNYEVEFYKQNHHNTYQKKPVYNFEMHTALFNPFADLGLNEYWTNASQRLLPWDGTTYGRLFSDDDFYIYLITHAYKHYAGSGTGLRTLLDCYVYNKAKGNQLDRAHIHDDLARPGIADYEESVRALSQKLFASPEQFSPDSLTPEDARLLNVYATSGTYGSVESKVTNKVSAMVSEGEAVSGSTKLKYLWRRIFPDLEVFRVYFPFFHRHKWLLPVGYVYRLINRAIVHRNQLKRELKTLKKL